VIASITVPLPPDVDVAACVFGSRRAEERYFVWEQPDREGFALGGIGSAWTVDAVPGHDRFGAAAAQCIEVTHEAVCGTEHGGIPGSGPVWMGGFAFGAGDGTAPEWASLPATLMTLPEVSLVRHAGRAAATANVVCTADSDNASLVSLATARLETMRADALPLVDPDPVGGYDIESVLPPERYEESVARAAARIRAGDLDKVVLAREVQVTAPAPFHAGSVFAGLRAGYPSCFCFCVGTPTAAFVGASPELLVRREGARLSTVALAGSTRRSADPAVDDHLGERLLHSAKDLDEHRIVVRTIERALDPLSVWVAAAEEPVLVRVANIQHLGTPVRAQLAEPRSAIELAGALHPTSAVGGEPWPRAEQTMRELEEMDRGWYAGPVGWMDSTEDGEFCVALRCALLESRMAHCYAGVGVVGDSDPEAELAETEVKLGALLPVLTGS
jgi:salicylate biosynthesis isochorismate synthase/menaquinone-specific isochorismate synthase